MPSDAEERMIEAAERIAAEEGLGAMSLRAVQAAAGQRNKSAAQYHFGSREGLIERIVVHRMGPINERRVEMLGTLPDEATLADLVEVFVRPTAEAVLSGRPSYWARFVIAGTADPTVADVVRVHLQGEGFRVIARRLLAALDHLPEATRARRLEQVFSLVFASLARAEREPMVDDVDALITDLVVVCVAILAVGTSPSTAGIEARALTD
ncbi:MAG: TetR family transcriptional regulator [Acidimicrobiales bacterium]